MADDADSNMALLMVLPTLSSSGRVDDGLYTTGYLEGSLSDPGSVASIDSTSTGEVSLESDCLVASPRDVLNAELKDGRVLDVGDLTSIEDERIRFTAPYIRGRLYEVARMLCGYIRALHVYPRNLRRHVAYMKSLQRAMKIVLDTVEGDLKQAQIDSDIDIDTESAKAPVFKSRSLSSAIQKHDLDVIGGAENDVALTILSSMTIELQSILPLLYRLRLQKFNPLVAWQEDNMDPDVLNVVICWSPMQSDPGDVMLVRMIHKIHQCLFENEKFALEEEPEVKNVPTLMKLIQQTREFLVLAVHDGYISECTDVGEEDEDDGVFVSWTYDHLREDNTPYSDNTDRLDSADVPEWCYPPRRADSGDPEPSSWMASTFTLVRKFPILAHILG